LETLAARQGKLPTALDEEPELFVDVLPYYEAYRDLMNSRSIGMAVGPVPMTEIAAYLTLHPHLDAGLLIRYVRELDGVYLEHVANNRQKPKHNPIGGRRTPVRKASHGHRGT
jgi:hypothetical protein